jgi:transposase
MGFISDAPAKEDLFGRKAFAYALVDRIKRYYYSRTKSKKKMKARSMNPVPF